MVPSGSFQIRLGDVAMRLVGHDHVGRQPVREGADFARGAAGRGLAGQRERAVAGLGDFSGKEMDVIDEVVAPDAAGVLVEAHGPETGDLDLRVGIEFGQRLEPVLRHARHLRGLLQRVVGEELDVFVIADVGGVAGLGAPGRLFFQRMFRAQAVSDVGLAALEQGMPVDEVLVDPSGFHDVIGDGIEQIEVGLRLEHHADIGEVERAMLEGRQHGDAHMRRRKAAIGDPGPQDRVHLSHVRTPQHERVGGLDVVVATHRLVDAEGAHEADRGGRHAMAGIRIEIVGAEAGLHQLQSGIAFPDRPLPGAEHADPARATLLQRVLEFLRHDVEGFVPRDLCELAVLVVFAGGLAQHRLGEAVVAVHDLGEEIAFYAVQPAIDFRLDVAMGRDHAIVLGRHHDAATGAAEPARRLVPLQFARGTLGDDVGGACDGRHPAGEGSHRRRLELENLTAVELGFGHGNSPDLRWSRRWRGKQARRSRRRATARVG